MSVYRIEKNRLQIADDVRDRFVIAHNEFGSGIAYSSDTLIVFNDDEGTKSFPIRPDTFRWLGGEFFILCGFLHHNVFRLGRINPDEILGFTNVYVWDHSKVYYLNGPVDGANAAAFQDLGEFWARDDQKCFFQEREILGGDAASFRVIDDTFAVDKDRIYGFGGRVIAECSADPAPLGNGYYAIAGHVFFGSRKMPDADLQTFRVLPVIGPENKRRIWAAGGPKDEVESMAVSGFTAYDSHHKYKGAWHPPERK